MKVDENICIEKSMIDQDFPKNNGPINKDY